MDARAEALVGLARAAAQAGELDRARDLADRAEAAAEAISDPRARSRILAGLTRAAASTGDLDRARDLAGRAKAAAKAIESLDPYDPATFNNQSDAPTQMPTPAARALGGGQR